MISEIPRPVQLRLPLRGRGSEHNRAVVVPGQVLQAGAVLSVPTDEDDVPVRAPLAGTVIEFVGQRRPGRERTDPVVVLDTGVSVGPAAVAVGASSGDLLKAPDVAIAAGFHRALRSDRALTAGAFETALRTIRDAGLVGLGGGGFATHVKLREAHAAGARHLVVNAAECEPPIQCDEALLAEYLDEVLGGADLVCGLLGLDSFTLAIANRLVRADGEHWRPGVRAPGVGPKPSDFDAGIRASIDVQIVDDRYLAGDERLLLERVLNRSRFSRRPPAEEGCVVLNVGTLVALSRALTLGQPLTSRVVTVCLRDGDPLADRVAAQTADRIANRCVNLNVPFGTPLTDLFAHAHGVMEPRGAGLPSSQWSVRIGGAVMGEWVEGDALSTGPETNCVALGSPRWGRTIPVASPCIQCGACVTACPYELTPQEMYRKLVISPGERLSPTELATCTLCGACNLVCPSHIDLRGVFTAQRQAERGFARRAAQASRARARYERHQKRGHSEPLLGTPESAGPASAMPNSPAEGLGDLLRENRGENRVEHRATLESEISAMVARARRGKSRGAKPETLGDNAAGRQVHTTDKPGAARDPRQLDEP